MFVYANTSTPARNSEVSHLHTGEGEVFTKLRLFLHEHKLALGTRFCQRHFHRSSMSADSHFPRAHWLLRWPVVPNGHAIREGGGKLS